MSLEKTTANLNSDYFLPEFTFSNATFSPAHGTEVELADGLIWLEDSAIAFQLKERTTKHRSSKKEDDRWFDKKVLGQATKQIRDTLQYLEVNESITAKNERGQKVVLRKKLLKRLVKVLIYTSFHPRNTKFHHSRTAGFIHILPLDDYKGVVSTLATLAELFDYFEWREALLQHPGANDLPEQSLLGHYLWGDSAAPLEFTSMRFLYALKQKVHEWDLSGILQKFYFRSYEGPIEDNRYHRIIGEVAKLNRIGLKAFKERFALSMERAKKDEFTLPYRFVVPDTGCGFVFIPLQQEARDNRRIALHNLTMAHKYAEKLDRCIGLVFVSDSDGFFTVDWCLIEQEWAQDPEMDAQLSKSFPFRKTNHKHTERYSFASDVI